VEHETQEAVAAVTLDRFEQVCDQVDAELGEAMCEVFTQKRIRSKAAAYVQTLCRDDVPVKTCWDMAEAAGFEGPRPFQSLMSVNDWDCADLWDVIAGKASELSVCPDDDRLGPGVAVDETGQPKRGRHTAGVGVQYAGFAGRKVNCVTSVTLCLVTATASTWVGNELFLQEKEWFTGQDDRGTARRASVGAADLEFESKPQIARRKLAELRARGVKFRWAAGDEVYGRSARLRKDHEDNKEAYAYFVPRDFMVELSSGRARVRADEALHLARGTTEVRACGDGLKGPRLYAWTMVATASPEHSCDPPTRGRRRTGPGHAERRSRGHTT
jgi:SRSO17 transposase